MLSLILDQLTDSPKHIADLDEAKDLIDNLGEINYILEICTETAFNLSGQEAYKCINAELARSTAFCR